MVVSMQSLTVKLQSDFALHVLFVRDPCSQSQEIEVCLGKRGGCINRNKQISSKTSCWVFWQQKSRVRGQMPLWLFWQINVAMMNLKEFFKSCPLHSHFSLNGIFGNVQLQSEIVSCCYITSQLTWYAQSQEEYLSKTRAWQVIHNAKLLTADHLLLEYRRESRAKFQQFHSQVFFLSFKR